MTREEEVNLINLLLQHPAGYDIDIQGTLWVRRYEYPVWAVEWEVQDGSPFINVEVKEFNSTLEAAKFFVDKRYEMKMGLDFEFVTI